MTDTVQMPREATREMTMAGCDSLPSCEHVFGHAGEMLRNAYRKMVEVGQIHDVAQASPNPFNRKQVEAVCRAVCKVEGLDPDDDTFGDGCDPAWTRYTDAVAEALAAQPPAAPVETDGEKAARDYEHGYNDGIEWAQTHGRCSAGNAEVSLVPMALSDGRTDYFVQIKVGDRAVTPHVFREEYKSAYHVALYDWLLNGKGEEPDCVEFGPDDWPGRVMHAVPQTLSDIVATIPEDLNWLIGKGKTRPDEPPFGVQLLRGLKIVAETEGDDLCETIKAAVALTRPHGASAYAADASAPDRSRNG